MKSENKVILSQGVEVPESALLVREKKPRYGTVAGLSEDELADPAELERQIYRREFAPVLQLPVQGRQSGLRPGVDESGDVDWGAFATVDFDRIKPDFDKARYKAEKLREELRDALIMLQIISERMPGRAKYRVLKGVRMGAIDPSSIVHEDMRAMARYYVRSRRLQREIASAMKASRRRREDRRRELGW